MQRRSRNGNHRPTALISDAGASELLVWSAAVARAKSALSKTFEGRMEVALASFEVVPEHGRGAAGHTLADFASEVGVGYAALDQYRQVMKWLGDFVYVYEISSYSLARQAQVSGCWGSGAEFAAFLAVAESPGGLPWTVAGLRLYAQGQPAHEDPELAGQRAEREPAASSGTQARTRPRVVAAKAAQRVQGLIAKGVSTTYPEEEDVCWKKAAALIRAHGLRVEVSAGS